ncbi:MAG: Mitochondrial ATPase complex subunit atp10 [Cirrosporium novae-zelandiae]|nr:MAG: Mitochondrial ATPase complex subunit atp10 [Cirrosporium novae-zelandiae]
MKPLRPQFFSISRRPLETCVFCNLRTTYPPFRTYASAPLIPTENPNEDEFFPKPLARPLGLQKPPRPSENTGIDSRSWRERREDFVNYDKHIVKREKLSNGLAKSYFRDWGNLRVAKGKTFIAVPKLFRADRALYYPNLQGVTLASPDEPQDTTPILRGKLSVVRMFSSEWAKRQTESFVAEDQNPELCEVLRAGKAVGAQMVDVNVEDNWVKAALIKLFMPSLRKKLPEEGHGRYFLITSGLTEKLRVCIGLVNSKVGYVYLVDEKCKIRWAGSGKADQTEKESIVNGLKRLIEVRKGIRGTGGTAAKKDIDNTKSTKKQTASAA